MLFRSLIQDRDYVLEMNKAIKHRISEIGKVMDIEFLTPPKGINYSVG